MYATHVSQTSTSSFTPPSATDHIINSRVQPLQIPTPSASAPKQILSPPQVPPSSAPKASPIPQNSFAAETLKPFGPIGHQQSSDPATIKLPHTDPITPIDLNTKVNTSTTPATLFTKIGGGLPPTAGQAQTLTPPPSYSPSSVAGVNLKVDEQGFLARSKQASAPLPVVANVPLAPNSVVPANGPVLGKSLVDTYSNNKTTLARTSNIVNQLNEAPSASSSPILVPIRPLKGDSAIDFTVGFFKGLKNGAKESATDFIPGLVAAAKTIGNFTVETIKRPIEHTKEVYAAIEETVVYLRTHDIGEIGQKLAPEVHKLVTEWDTLSSDEKGELTGYCIGKYGTDLALTAGALKGVKIAGTVLRTEVAVGGALKEAVAVSNASKAVAGGVETGVLVQEAKAATRVVGVVERSAVAEARAGSAVGTAIAGEVKVASQPAQVAEKAPKLAAQNETAVTPATKVKEPIRTEPRNLQEQLALQEAKAHKVAPEYEIMKGKINDPKYPPKEWKKVDYVHENPDGTKIDIHYWENRLTGEKKEFKFKDYESQINKK